MNDYIHRLAEELYNMFYDDCECERIPFGLWYESNSVQRLYIEKAERLNGWINGE